MKVAISPLKVYSSSLQSGVGFLQNLCFVRFLKRLKIVLEYVPGARLTFAKAFFREMKLDVLKHQLKLFALFRKWYMLSYENLKIFLKFTLMQTSKDVGWQPMFFCALNRALKILPKSCYQLQMISKSLESIYSISIGRLGTSFFDWRECLLLKMLLQLIFLGGICIQCSFDSF